MVINPGIELLAREVCHAVHRLRGEHQTWIAFDHLEGEDGIALSPTLLDAAVAFAVAKRWLVIAGAPSGEMRLRLASAEESHGDGGLMNHIMRTAGVPPAHRVIRVHDRRM